MLENEPSRVSVVLPALNEADVIGEVIDRVRSLRDSHGYDLEIIVIDGGSRDATIEVAKAHGATRIISFPKRRGKGADFWTGTLVASGDYIVQIDSDHQFEPLEIPKIVDRLRAGADMAIATRFVKDADLRKESVRPLNMFGNWLFSWIVSILIGQRVTDSLAGFKGFRRSIIPVLQIRSPHFGYEVELIIRAARAKKKIVEIPVTHYKREKGSTNVRRFKDGALIFGSILAARCTGLVPSPLILPSEEGSRPVSKQTEEASDKNFFKIGPYLKRIPPFASVLLIAVVLYAPVLFFGKIFSDFDMITEGYAYGAYFADHPGRWLESQYSNAMYGGVNLGYYPDNNFYGFFMALKPAFMTMPAFLHGVIFAYFLTFLCFTYLFFKDRGFSSVLASGLTAFVGFSERILAVFSSWLWVASFFLFPAVCVFLLRLRRRPSWKTAILGGFILAFGLLSAHPGAPILFSVPLGAYAVYLFADAWRENRASAKRYVAAVAGMLAVALACSWWYLGPVYRLALETPRGSGMAFADAQVGALSIFDAPKALLPQWSLFSSSEGYLYVAFAGIALALVSLMRKPSSEESFWRWVVFAGIVYAVPRSPIAYLFAKLPLLNGVRVPARALYFVMFGVAYLAGQGALACADSRESLVSLKRWYVLRWSALLALMLILAGTVFDLFGGFGFVGDRVIAWFDAHRYAQTTGLPLEHYHNVIRSILDGIRANFKLTEPLTLVALGGLLSTYIVLFRRPRISVGAISAILILCSGGYALAKGLPLERTDAGVLVRVPESAVFLRSQPGIDRNRIFTYAYGASKFELLDTPSRGRVPFEEQAAFADDLLIVNTNLTHGLQSIDGYDNFMTRRSADLLNAIQSESVPTGNAISRSKMTREEKKGAFISRANVLGMMNVKYVVSAVRFEEGPLKTVWSGTTSRGIPYFIYENPLVLPRVYLARHVSMIPPDESQALNKILETGKDFSRDTLLECASCDVPEDGSPSDMAEIVSYEPGRVEIGTSASGTRLLVFNENYLRGWSAVLDGKTIPIHPVNGIFNGVIVPSGAHDVQFIYSRP
jgi:glycosyltransferase involved in cell wall biosynthesis